MANSVADTEMSRLVGLGYLTGTLRDRQMQELIDIQGPTPASITDRWVVGAIAVYPFGRLPS